MISLSSADLFQNLRKFSEQSKEVDLIRRVLKYYHVPYMYIQNVDLNKIGHTWFKYLKMPTFEAC